MVAEPSMVSYTCNGPHKQGKHMMNKCAIIKAVMPNRLAHRNFSSLSDQPWNKDLSFLFIPPGHRVHCFGRIIIQTVWHPAKTVNTQHSFTFIDEIIGDVFMKVRESVLKFC